MVTKVTSLSRTGLSDWLIQRVSAVILTAYFIFLFTYLFSAHQLTFWEWRDLFDSLWMKLFSLLALLSLIVHSWVGIWTILTDYIGPPVFRGLCEIILVLVLILCFFWGINILWWGA